MEETSSLYRAPPADYSGAANPRLARISNPTAERFDGESSEPARGS